MKLDELDQKVWLRTDEHEELIDALEHGAALAAQLASDDKVWRWLIIALHLSVQGACVCALRGRDTIGISVLTEQSAKKMWHWIDVESRANPKSEMPQERLAKMLQLFARVQDTARLPLPHRLVVDESTATDVKSLNSRRNEFIHFVPKSWSLELSRMPRVVHHVCDVIEHLAVKHPTFRHHLDEAKASRIAAALDRIREGIAAWAKARADL